MRKLKADEKFPICGGRISVEFDYISKQDATIRLQCTKCHETAIYDIAPDLEEVMGDYLDYLPERVKTIEG